MSIFCADWKPQSDPLSIKNYAKEISWCRVRVSQNLEKHKLAGLFSRHSSHHRHLGFKSYSPLGFYFFKIISWKLTFFT